MSDSEECFGDVEAVGRDGEIVWITEETTCFICCTCSRCCVVGYRGECDECGRERCYQCATGSTEIFYREECTRTKRKTLKITKPFAKIEIRREDVDLFDSYSVVDYNGNGQVLQKVYSRYLLCEHDLESERPSLLLTLRTRITQPLPLVLCFNKCQDELMLFVTLENDAERDIQVVKLVNNTQEI